MVVDSLCIINIVAPIVLCRGEVGRVFDLFCCRLYSVFLSIFFSDSSARCRGLVCDLWHFLPDHTRILFCILDKAPIMVSLAIVYSSRQIDMCRERLGLFCKKQTYKKDQLLP